MGLFSGLLGNASEISDDKLEKLLDEILIDDEVVEKAYQIIRDVFVFTNKRLILADRQGVTGRKAELLSIPYSKITKFSRESAGFFDMEAELKIWIGSEAEPIRRDFGRSVNINEVYAVLSKYVLS